VSARPTNNRRGRRKTAASAPPPRAAAASRWSSRRWRRIALAAGAALVLGGLALALAIGFRAGAPVPAVPPVASVTPGAGVPAAAPSFVGAARCAACHAKETEAYRGSDHARAMEPATEQTVRGDFSGTQFSHRGVTSTFLRRDGKFLVRTDGPDGKPGEFEITYTFGARPLQQYLVPLAGGVGHARQGGRRSAVVPRPPG
jgi:hypothetical protein